MELDACTTTNIYFTLSLQITMCYLSCSLQYGSSKYPVLVLCLLYFLCNYFKEIKFQNYSKTLCCANLRFCKNLMHLKQPAKLEHCQIFILCKSSMNVYFVQSVLFLQKGTLIAKLVHFMYTKCIYISLVDTLKTKCFFLAYEFSQVKVHFALWYDINT